MWSEPVTFTIPGVPVPKGRPKASVRRRGSRAFVNMRTPDATRAYEALVARHAPRVAVPERGIYWVRAVFVVRDRPKTRPSHTPPVSWADPEPFHVGQTDVDNHVKALLDGLQGWMGNDARVVRLEVEKRCGDVPRVDVAVRWVAA